jgi:hypothetical protein
MPFAPMPSFGQSQMQRILAARGQPAIDVNQVLHAADFRAQDDLLRAQPILLGQFRRVERAHHDRFHRDFARVFRLGEPRILVHHLGQQRLVERSPIHADAHRLLILHRNFDHGAEVVVVLAANADVAGINAVFGQPFGALGIFDEQLMPVVMEVADDGDANALASSPSLMWGIAFAASSLLTVTRTTSLPARASAATCLIVPGISAVSVLVMDCTITGASLPTRTPPIDAVNVFLRIISAIGIFILTGCCEAGHRHRVTGSGATLNRAAEV